MSLSGMVEILGTFDVAQGGLEAKRGFVMPALSSPRWKPGSIPLAAESGYRFSTGWRTLSGTWIPADAGMTTPKSRLPVDKF